MAVDRRLEAHDVTLLRLAIEKDDVGISVMDAENVLGGPAVDRMGQLINGGLLESHPDPDKARRYVITAGGEACLKRWDRDPRNRANQSVPTGPGTGDVQTGFAARAASTGATPRPDPAVTPAKLTRAAGQARGLSDQPKRRGSRRS